MLKKRSVMLSLRVGARSSPLSKKQVEEVFQQMPIPYEPVFVETSGDLDKETSLREMETSDFFTKELDEMVRQGEVRVAVHSAKDLPEPMPPGLKVIALTEGVDPSDSLVLRDGESLKPGMVIATSSKRREEMVKEDVTFVDIRGTIEERLAKLDCGEVDGVVIAEAALIRLGLTHRNRLRLDGETVPLQGRLAVVARADDEEMADVFSPLSRP